MLLKRIFDLLIIQNKKRTRIYITHIIVDIFKVLSYIVLCIYVATRFFICFKHMYNEKLKRNNRHTLK